MKSAVFCSACNTLTRASAMFKVKAKVRRPAFNPDGSQTVKEQVEVLTICPACARRAGYKVRGEG